MDIMDDNIFTLKTDIQQCIANNIKEFKNNYRLLLFEGEQMELAQSLGCLENLEIKPSESLMQFKGEIATDLEFSEEEFEKIKRCALQQNFLDMARQITEDKKSPKQKENERIIAEMKFSNFLEDLENSELYEYRDAKPTDKMLMKYIQSALNEIGLNLNYEEHKETIMLTGNFEYLKFTREELRTLIHLLQNVNFFLIAPHYGDEEENQIILNEDEEKCLNIRIVIGIDLVKEE